MQHVWTYGLCNKGINIIEHDLYLLEMFDVNLTDFIQSDTVGLSDKFMYILNSCEFLRKQIVQNMMYSKYINLAALLRYNPLELKFVCSILVECKRV
jgi:hypothetical protein